MKFRFYHTLLILAIILASNSSFATASNTETLEDKPIENYSDFKYTPTTSHIAVPLDIDIKTIQKTLNTNVPNKIYEDNNIEDDSLQIKVWKNGEFIIHFDGNYLTSEIPLKIWAKTRIGVAGITHTDWDVNGEIKVIVKTKLQISKSWNFISSSKISNYVWTKRPTTNVAGINIPITYIVDKILKDNQKKLESLVDQAIASNVPTRTYAKGLWDQVQQPIPIQAGDYKAWIDVTPNSILMQPLTVKGETIKTGFKVDCKVNVVVGSPTTKNKKTDIPECRLNSNITPGLEINLLANIPYQILDSVANSTLCNEKIGEGKHSVLVDSVKTYGQGDSLVIGLAVHGYLNGNIYLVGKPYFDQTLTAIKLKDVNYTLKTKNVFKKVLSAVVKPMLKNKIEEKLIVPMKDNFYVIQEIANSNVMNSKWADNIYTKGQISKIEGKEIYISKPGVQVNLNIQGNINILYK